MKLLVKVSGFLSPKLVSRKPFMKSAVSPKGGKVLRSVFLPTGRPAPWAPLCGLTKTAADQAPRVSWPLS
ncbi:hypothetical protein D3C75_991860 [compost metagenome]